MCRPWNIAMRDYQESVTTGQTDTWRDRQSDPNVPICFAGAQKLYSVPPTSLNVTLKGIKQLYCIVQTECWGIACIVTFLTTEINWHHKAPMISNARPMGSSNGRQLSYQWNKAEYSRLRNVLVMVQSSTGSREVSISEFNVTTRTVVSLVNLSLMARGTTTPYATSAENSGEVSMMNVHCPVALGYQKRSTVWFLLRDWVKENTSS